jgi:hypothetical protein
MTSHSNATPILALVGMQVLALGTYVGACEVRASDGTACEVRWATVLPAIALAGQSAATFFMDPAGRYGTPGRAPRAPKTPASPIPPLPMQQPEPRSRGRRGDDGQPY